MLFRVVVKPHKDDHKQTWAVQIYCTKCGIKNIGSTFKSSSLTSMNMMKCSHCNGNLGNQEHLNKNKNARLSYHVSK